MDVSEILKSVSVASNNGVKRDESRLEGFDAILQTRAGETFKQYRKRIRSDVKILIRENAHLRKRQLPGENVFLVQGSSGYIVVPTITDAMCLRAGQEPVVRPYVELPFSRVVT